MDCYLIPLWLVTWPYFWTFSHYTTKPISVIADSIHDHDNLIKAVHGFKRGKENELRFVKIASTLSAAAAVGALSWPSIAQTPWLALALFYTSLLLAAIALICAAQHSALLDTAFSDIEEAPHLSAILRMFLRSSRSRASHSLRRFNHSTHAATPITATLVDRQQVDWNMIFIWQFPLMLMSWSWVAFLVAMTLHITRPLFPGLGGPDGRKVAIFFIAMCATVCVTLAWTSFWAYRSARRWAFPRVIIQGAVSQRYVMQSPDLSTASKVIRRETV